MARSPNMNIADRNAYVFILLNVIVNFKKCVLCSTAPNKRNTIFKLLNKFNLLHLNIYFLNLNNKKIVSPPKYNSFYGP